MLLSSAMLPAVLVLLLAVTADSAAVSNATASHATATNATASQVTATNATASNATATAGTSNAPLINRNLDQYGWGYVLVRSDIETGMAQTSALVNWAYASNLTEANRSARRKLQQEDARLEKQEWKTFNDMDWKNNWKYLKNPDLIRLFRHYATEGMSALPATHLTEYHSLITDMESIYAKAKVHLCVNLNGQTSCELSLEPELTQLMKNARYSRILTAAWVKWRDVSGKRVREKYIKYVALSNEGAKLNNYSDMGEMWLRPYESPNFRKDLEGLWHDLKPLYQQVHAYVRRHLRQLHGEHLISKRGPIPASLLGDMWGQHWQGISDFLMPYPNKPSVDVTNTMKKQGYTPLKMFKLADQFFTSLNLTAMLPKFWKNSIMVKPPHTEMVCHASAWNFYKQDDFRIKMCTDVTMKDLFTVHHEMGHIQYYMQYKDLPFPYRGGANPGFHEAVGDSLSLSVQTPRHLYKVGLLSELVEDKQADLNFLMKMALDKVMFLPFGYLIDKYRWDVFSGKIASADLNCAWWKLRYELQGLKPPVKRTEKDFDPGAKYHVVANVPYIRYFVSFIVQFQFHKAMCIKAGQYDPENSLPLHKCDIDNSAAAGNALASMLQMGASRPWPDALEKLTGTRKLDVNVLREYFKPLEEWLTADNKKHGEFIGWEKDGDYCE